MSVGRLLQASLGLPDANFERFDKLPLKAVTSEFWGCYEQVLGDCYKLPFGAATGELWKIAISQF